MAILGAVLLIAAAALLALSIRGRVVARGRFCRRCRFDLAGLTHPGACPECGADLGARGSTITRIRRLSRPLLALSLLLFAGAGVVAFSSVTGAIAAISKATDAQVLLLQRLGVSEALTEAAARTTRAVPLSDQHWKVLIRRGLAHQDDTATPWDPRWGDILVQAFVQNRMTEEESRRFLSHLFATSVRFRDRIAHDSDSVGYALRWPRGRIGVSTTDVRTDMSYSLVVSRTGVVGDGRPSRDTGSGMRGPLIFHRTGFGDLGDLQTSVRLPRDRPRAETVRVYVETRLTLHGDDGRTIPIDPVMHEATVRVLPPGEPVVRAVPDPTAAEIIREQASVTPLSLFFPDEDKISPGGQIGELEIHFEHRPRAVAGRVFIAHESGELELGEIRNPAGEEPHGFRLSVRVPTTGADERLALLRRLAARGAVDVVFRTDPGAAEHDPRIDEVAEVTLWFRDVPVRVVPNQGKLDEMVWEKRIPAAPAPGPDGP